MTCFLALSTGLHFLRNYGADLQDDLIFSSDDDDTDDEYLYPRSSLDPHPRIRQLTNEVTLKHFAY